MKYQPGLPEHNDNISHAHPIKEFAVLLGALLLIVALCYAVLGALVDAAVTRISPEMEQSWFKNTPLNAALASMMTKDESLTPYRAELFESLKQCADIDYDLRLWTVDSEIVNAVAIPGGDIVVFGGLIERLKTENGLAFVLAHEIAHFKHRDHLRGMGRAAVLTFLVSIVAGADAKAIELLTPMSSFSQANYSQSREADADVLALSILNCHYGHVSGATEFFEVSLREDESEYSKFTHYFSSHPQLRERILQLKTLTDENSYLEGEPSLLE